MTKNFYIFLFLLSFGFGLTIFAQIELPPDTFPIAELGNCKNNADCAAYCDKPENMKACLDYAQAHNLLPKEDIDMGRKMLEVGETGGPGDCNGQEECETYCNVPSHMEECIIFARDNGLIPPEELAEAEAALAAIQKGATPPPCQGKAACDIYCSQEEHLEECITFGEAAGFIKPEEVEMIRKTGGKGPGNCRGKAECDAYCQNPDNMEECITFGIEHGLMPPQEAGDAQKMLQAIKKGVKPPPCQGKEECDIYCSQEEHMEECINFSEAAGFMAPEEAEQARKMAKAGLFGKGPGGCKGKEECEAFCENPDNMVECIEFSVKAGFMSPEEGERALKMAQSGMMGGPGGCQGQEECEAYCADPTHMEECMQFGQQQGFMNPEEAERAKLMGNLQAMRGPGGCKSKEECEAYCADPTHMEECMQFGQQQGLMTPQQVEQARMLGPQGPGGPGGCKSKEECEVYCADPVHMEECVNFSAQQGLIKPEEEEWIRKRMETPCVMQMTAAIEPQSGACVQFSTPCDVPPGWQQVGQCPEGAPPFGGPSPEFIQPPEGMTPPEGMMPPGGTTPPAEFTPEFTPSPGETVPPAEAPQSLFEIGKKFLANILSAFKIK